MAVLLLLLFASSLSAASPAEAARQVLSDWTKALVAKDQAALEVLLADRLSYAHTDGVTVQDKVQFIASIMSGNPGYESLDLDGVTIHPYGAAAIVSASVNVKLPGRQPSPVRLMQLYVEDRGRWQLAASGATRQRAGTAQLSALDAASDISPSATPLSAPRDPESAAVMQAALGWTGAMIDKDKAAIDPLLADDLLFGHSDGGPPKTRSEHLAATAANRYEALPMSDVSVQVYGDAAVLTANIDTKYFGRPSFRVRTIQIFVKRPGRWQLAAFQSTRAVQPKP